MLLRPMKAPTDPITDAELKSIKFPVVGSPKLDGFRCLVDERGGLTSSMKPFTNRFVAETLKNPTYLGLDGEIVVGAPYKENDDDDVFHRTSGPIRRFDGEPNFKLFVFDNWKYGGSSYNDRWIQSLPTEEGRIIVLEQKFLKNADEVIAFEQEMVEKGYEGAMIRSLWGKYKEGRTTLREQNIFKRKPFEECDAEIIGFEEATENLNEKITDSRGLSHRSSHQENKHPKGTLGNFICRSPMWPTVESFKAGPGSGFTDVLKQDIWNHKEDFIGRIVSIKYQKYGSIDKPRMPKVLKIREGWDL